MKSTLLLVANLVLIGILGFEHFSNAPAVHAQGTTGKCVDVWSQSSSTGPAGSALTLTCLDLSALATLINPSGFPPVGNCTAPSSGVALYAQISSTNCIPIVAIPATNFVARAIPPTSIDPSNFLPPITFTDGATALPGQVVPNLLTYHYPPSAWSTSTIVGDHQ